MSVDRREQNRVPVRHEVAFDYYTFDGKKLGRGYGVTINISASGLMLDTDKALEPAMKVLVEFISPTFMFMARGHIVYTYFLEEHHYRAGIQLEEMIQGGWDLIQELSGP